MLEPPRIAEDLPAAPLPVCDATGEVSVEGVRVEAGAEDPLVSGLSVDVAESDLAGVTFGAEGLRRLDVRDSVLRGCDLSNVRTRRCSLQRVEVRQSRLVGFSLSEGDVQDVLVVGGTLMLASFERSRLLHVVFEEVNLRDVSFSGAFLEGVSFSGCDLAGADFRGARLRDCVLRGGSLDGVAGIDSLRGLSMPWPDLVASAGALAGALGIAVLEE